MLNVNTCAVHARSKVFSIKIWVSKKNRFNEQGLNMFRDQGHMTYLRTFPEITGLPLKEVQCFITVLFCKPGVMPGENSYLQRTLVMLRGKAQDSLNIN